VVEVVEVVGATLSDDSVKGCLRTPHFVLIGNYDDTPKPLHYWTVRWPKFRTLLECGIIS
jgi:hypothetical protein